MENTDDLNKYQINNIPEYRPINWRKYIFLLLTNWYWFLIAVFIAMSFAYLKNRYTLPVYTASATLLIEEGANDLISEIRSVNKRRRTRAIANEISILKSFSLHRRTVDCLGWDIFWTGHGRVAMERPLYKKPPFYIEIDTASEHGYINKLFNIDSYNNKNIRLSDNNDLDTILSLNTWHNVSGWNFRITKGYNPDNYASYSFIIFDSNTLARRYQSKLRIEANEQSGTIIKISSQGTVQNREIEYINMLCQNYIASGQERGQLIAENTLRFIDDQINIIQDSLSQTEQQLLDFRLDKKVVNLNQDAQQAYDQLKYFYQEKIQLRLKRNYYEYLKKYTENRQDSGRPITPILVNADDEMLANEVSNLRRLNQEREILEFSAQKENPEMIQLDQQLKTSYNKVNGIIEELLNNNKQTLDQINVEEQHVESQLLKLPANEQAMLNIQRKNEINNQFFTFLLEKRAEAGIQKASTISDVRILDKAEPFTISISGTRSSFIYLAALLIGLLVPGGIIVLADHLDTRIKDRQDIEDNTNLPILGIVAHNDTGAKIPVQFKPDSVFAESFRHIRTNLQYLLRDPGQKIIMITSIIAQEGKTFIGTNLAAILAMNNKKVIIVGFDLRRPTLHRIFNIENTKGISTFLAGTSELKEIIYKTDIERLDVMIAGPIPPNPAELLETNRMAEIIKTVSDQYDYIILDTPPVALVTDAVLISKYSHTNIFVIRQNFSHTAEFELINNLRDERIKGINLMVNDIKESKPLGYRYYYGYGYGYGYGYTYNYKYGYTSYREKSGNT